MKYMMMTRIIAMYLAFLLGLQSSSGLIYAMEEVARSNGGILPEIEEILPGEGEKEDEPYNRELRKYIRYSQLILTYAGERLDGRLEVAQRDGTQKLNNGTINDKQLAIESIKQQLAQILDYNNQKNWDTLEVFDQKIKEAEAYPRGESSETTWDLFQKAIEDAKLTIEQKIYGINAEIIQSQIDAIDQAMETLIDAEKPKEEIETLYYITEDDQVEMMQVPFEPSKLKDGHYQIYRGTGWIRDESDLITSGILEGEGEGNSVKLSKATNTNVIHGLNVDANVSVSLQRKASIGANVSFGWNPAQVAITFTASTIMEASEDATLYAKLYVMSERIDTYHVVNGEIVEEMDAYRSLGTIGLYGEEVSASAINIMDYHVHEPVRVVLGEMETQGANVMGLPPQEAEDNVVVRPGGGIDLGELFEELTPMFPVNEVIKTKASAGTIDANYIRLDEEEGPMSSDNGETGYIDLRDGVYTRFLGSGWVIGGEGHIGTSTVMPNSVGTLAQKVQDSFKVTHSIGIEVGVEAESAGNKAKAAVKAAYSHAAETEEATTMEIKVKTSPQYTKHIDAYENNLKYDVITVENRKIVERSQVYLTNGIYARVVETSPRTPIEAGKEEQVFESLVEQDYIPSISDHYRLYVKGEIGPQFFKQFHAHKLAYGYDDKVNIQFQVQETGLYRLRGARAYGDYFTKPFQQPEYYVLPKSLNVYNVNPYSGTPNHEEYYVEARGEVPKYGGTFYEVYLQKGETYVVTIGESTRTETYKPPNYYGYTMRPSDMFGSVFELEKVSGTYVNTAQRTALKEVLDHYNTYDESDYLKESFLDFDRLRAYGNNLYERNEQAIPEAINQVIEDLKKAEAKLILIDYKPPTPEPEPEPFPDLEIAPHAYYVKVNTEDESAEKIPAKDPRELEDGIYMIDRGYGWIKNEQEDLIASAVLDAATEEGMIGVTRAVNTSITHTHKEDIFVGLQLFKIVQIGLNFGFGQTISESTTISASHTLIVPEGHKGYLKAYVLNHKYETFEIKDGEVISQAATYNPLGTISMVELTTDGVINEDDFIVKDDTYVFEQVEMMTLLDENQDEYDRVQMDFDEVGDKYFREATLPGGLEVGMFYKLDKTVQQIKAGQIPSGVPVASSEVTKDGVYLQYLGDGYINGEESFISTITSDPSIRSSIQSTTQTKSFTEGGTKEVIGVESGVFEMSVAMTYKFKQESGETISVATTTFDANKKSQLKVYDMYKRYRLLEVENKVVNKEEYLMVNSGLYGKTFVPGDYTAALSEETARNTLSTPAKNFSEANKNAYKGGADSITLVSEKGDGTLVPLQRMGYSLDTDVSKLPNGIYLIDLGDNWVQEEVSDLIGANSAYNYSTSPDSTMRTVLEQTIEAETQFAVEGTSTISKRYKDPVTQNKLKTSMTFIVGGGESIKEGAKSSSTLFIDPQENGLLKLYTGNRRTDLVEIKNGEIIDKLITYTPNGIRSTARFSEAGVTLNSELTYIGTPTKDTLTAAGAERVKVYTKEASYKPYLEREADLFITDAEARNHTYLSEVMYDKEADKLKDGIYTFYLGDWYTGREIGVHYVTAGSGGELKQDIVEQVTYTYKGGVYVTGLMDAINLSIATNFNTTFKYTNTITSGVMGFASSTDDLLKLKTRRQKFLTVTIKNNAIETQTITEKLIGTTGSISDTI